MAASHLRFAAGVCVLAAGLLMGGAGGAVAVADSSGSAAHSDNGTVKKPKKAPGGANTQHGAVSSSQQTGQQVSADAKKPKKAPGGANTQQGAVSSSQQTGQQVSADAKKPKKTPGGANTQQGAVSSSQQTGQQVSADAKKPKKTPGGANTQQGTVSSSGQTGQQTSDPGAPVLNVVVAPVPDVIALVCAQMPPDLAAFLFGTAGVEPVMDALGGIHGAGPSEAAEASVASQLLLRIVGAPLADNPAGVTTLGGMAPPISSPMTQVGRGSPLPGMAQSVFRRASSEPLLPASLTGLAAVALPGVGGLVGLTGLTATGALPLSLSLAALAAAALPGVAGFVGLTAVGVRIYTSRP